MSESVRDGSGGNDKLFWNWEGETGCIWHALILRITGASGSRCTENKYQLHKSSGTESKVFPLFVVSFLPAIDVKHVCTGRAAETGDLVKAGIRLLHPDLCFTLFLSVWLRLLKQVHSVYNLVGQMDGVHCRQVAFKKQCYWIKTPARAPTLSSCHLQYWLDLTDKSW